MNYQVQEIFRGIAQGLIDETAGMEVVNKWVALELETQKLMKPIYGALGGNTPAVGKTQPSA